jgi:hypothetical protein
MTTSVNETQLQSDNSGTSQSKTILQHLIRYRFLRELLIVLVFCLLTALVTWPYVKSLRDAVPGPGDPYLISWTMWWDYHQTFTDPLNLFHANAFYPYRYTLAFSETSYGVALLFFPLFALGFQPLTVHAVGMFFGFALSGYGAFRLTRTLTGSTGAAWVAGIIFGFIPYRFGLVAQLMYLFSAWLPLLFEALVLFIRQRTWKRAAWLGIAFFMTGLTTITWLLLSLIPFAVIGAVLLTRYEAWRDRNLWQRSIVSLGVAGIALLPFTVPFYIVSYLYGFKRHIDDVKAHSAMPYHWLVGEAGSKFWSRMGRAFPDSGKFQMFPGLLPLLFPLPEILRRSPVTALSVPEFSSQRRAWIRLLNVIILVSLISALLAMNFTRYDEVGLNYFYADLSFGIGLFAIIARLCLAYPGFLRFNGATNFVETIRSEHRSDAFWVGTLLVVLGFTYSIGWNIFFYRLLYYMMPGFKSIRAPMRGAMFAYLGLALLSGIGIKRLAEAVGKHRPQLMNMVVLIACVLLLIELNNAPMYFMHGDVYPDEVTLRLKQTPMHGGIMYFPAGPDFNQRYMLRAADHVKPIIPGTSGFNPPYVNQLEEMTASGIVPIQVMDLMEQIPASYLVVENGLIPEKRKGDFQKFLARSVIAGRLRFINRFDGENDLYAVVKTEPDTKSEAALPIDLTVREWSETIAGDPVSLLGPPLSWGQKLYRVHLATTGTMPRYKEFITDLENLSRGIIVGSDNQNERFAINVEAFAGEWCRREVFSRSFAHLSDAQFIESLIANSGVQFDAAERALLVDSLNTHRMNRCEVLLRVVDDQRFVDKENYKSLVLLHYFGYLRRNPDDPPDGDLRGFNFWLGDLERNHDPGKLAAAFKLTGEFHQFEKRIMP